ncbi:MAG: T9SS type A sorting domain-containing protein, partial [Bacteroidota bacterium]
SSPANVNVTPIATGVQTYTVTAVGNTSCPTGGTSSGSATVYVSTAPPATSAGQPVSPSTYACSGSVYFITTPAIAGQNIRYSWNTGSNSAVVLYSDNISGPFSPPPFQTTANQVYAQFGALSASSGYQICVQGVNGCGSTNNRCLSIRGIVGVPGTITPVSNIVACPNDVKSYSCGVSGGATQYNWTLAGSAAAITNGQGTQNVTVTFPAVFTSGQLCVTAQLPCGGSSTSAARCQLISNTPATPGAFTAGPNKVCPGATGVVYSIPSVTGAAGYNWTVPVNCTITSGTNTPSITVNFPAVYSGAPPVCVSALSACGTSAARCKTVGSNIPGQPGSVTGTTTNICNSSVQYSISNVAGASSYTWTNPAGTTITSGQGSTTILLAVGSSFTTGNLTVTANTTLCTPGTSTPRTILINGKPNTPSTETAFSGSWCNGGFVTFSVTPVTPQPTNNWTVSNGTITAGQGSTSIDVTWGTGTGTVNLTAGNTCGTSGTRTQSWTGTVCREEEQQQSSVGSQQFAVYPNPAHDNVTVSIYVKEQTQFNISLRDISGRVIVSEDREGTDGLNAYQMDLKSFAKGIYTLEVQSSDNSWKTKVVIE